MAQYVQAIGRRKTAIAQVRLIPGGSGKVTINNRDIADYFSVTTLRESALSPLREVGKHEMVDLSIRAVGGGLRGQADAVKMAIARALIKEDETLRASVKAKGLLTRDSRRKERKKFGFRGARRSKQWRKR